MILTEQVPSSPVSSLPNEFIKRMLIVEEVIHMRGQGVIWKLCVLSAQLCCEPKTALKTKSVD